MKSNVTTHAVGGRSYGRISEDKIAGLVTAAASGDVRAWNGLVKEFGGMIWAVARAYRLHHADAADVSQATWLRLVENLGQLKEPSRVGPWLATTARRECLRVLRETDRRVLCGEELPDRESGELSPDDSVLLSERNEALSRSFSRLRPSDRVLLRLLTADPRPPYEEISAALDMPIGSIGPTRQRALARLRAELNGQGNLELMID
jgi:RNA polymerase sigma factor (sigma-70 family)